MKKFKVVFMSDKINEDGSFETVEIHDIRVSTPKSAVQVAEFGISGMKPENGGNFIVKSVVDA